MSSSGERPAIRQSTAMFMRSALQSAADDALIVTCRVCIKATVPIPDPQRPRHETHCYRCGADYLIRACSACGSAAIIPRARPDAAAPLCEACS